MLDKYKQDPARIVIKGVRDPSAWFRIESQHLIVYSDSDPEQVVQLVNNLERLDYVLRLYLRPFLIRKTELSKLTASNAWRQGHDVAAFARAAALAHA